MKRRLRLAMYALVPIAVVVATGIAFARGMHHRSPEQMKHFVEVKVHSTLDDLDASDAQRDQILGIVDGFLDTMNAAHQPGEHREMLEAIASAVETNSTDTTAIDQMIDERAARRTALAHEAVTAAKNINAILTPEQRTELASKIRSHHRHGHDGGHGPF